MTTPINPSNPTHSRTMPSVSINIARTGASAMGDVCDAIVGIRAAS